MTPRTDLDRRTFIRRGVIGASAALWMFSLKDLMGRRAHAAVASPYGPVSPRPDGTTGLSLVQLPDGFQYWSYSWNGDPLEDGVPCPSRHDGMAVVAQQSDSGRLILVRNHEVGFGVPYTVNPSITYAPDGAGGTTSLVFDVSGGRWQTAWASLAGTARNCAGGVTPWGTWISCEETGGAGHGWNFEVNPQSADPTPLRDMGRFSHEALMVDPSTGYVYETQDSGDAGFYRFVPNVAGQLAQGGQLEMLAVRGQPNADLGLGYPIGTVWDVEWVRVDDPTAAMLSTYAQGAARGGARFRRLEGAWWGSRTGFFLSTSGGAASEGQVFEYDPGAETITLIYESPTFQDCNNPDNMTVTPRGGLLLCEDGGGGTLVGGERLLGLTRAGEVFTFAVNNIVLAQAYNARVPAGDYRPEEWTGACYSPDGQWLFVNIQTPGVTFAITGPWGAGPL